MPTSSTGCCAASGRCASGIVSVIKSIFMLYYGFILPSADFEKVNDVIPLADWNMRVATRQRSWPSKKKYVCVNNFGFSGSNSTALKSSMFKLGIWLEQHAELYQTTMPRNLSYTLCQRRTHHQWRVAVMAGALNSHDVTPTRAPSEPPKLAFVFTGHPSGDEEAIDRVAKTF
ncbi:type I polyketide synthase [Lasiosphaeria hispida]|uniref:Type I polyketide synthase n=1 Tax=Lasiosphaeria hispida TaxID=260671 RepID=A0AAJ0HA56_9PEZI|nr:type I polyketide synthase [Lasiosphaeria hispida]